MFTVTDNALRQILLQMEQSQAQGLALRVAAKANADGSIHYGMGFDADRSEQDTVIPLQGIEVLIDPASNEILEETTMDFVELEPGQSNFIFLNPLDPNYTPPKKERKRPG